MKLKQCDKFKNHFYDGEKFSACPHCAKLGVEDTAKDSRRSGFFTKQKPAETPVPSPQADDKTVMLTQMLDEEAEPTVSADIDHVSLSGSVRDIKTVAMYDFEDDIQPVVGWLVVYSGEDRGKSFTLKTGKNTVGRSGGNEPDICLDGDLTISRGTQAIIVFDPKNIKYLLQTTDGASLLYLNNELLMTYSELHAYDRITIGATELIFIPFCTEEVQW